MDWVVLGIGFLCQFIPLYYLCIASLQRRGAVLFNFHLISNFYFFMENLKKIQLIEPSFDANQEVFRQELEEALGGWNCGSFDESVCNPYISGSCSGNPSSNEYCGYHTCNGKLRW